MRLFKTLNMLLVFFSFIFTITRLSYYLDFLGCLGYDFPRRDTECVSSCNSGIPSCSPTVDQDKFSRQRWGCVQVVSLTHGTDMLSFALMSQQLAVTFNCPHQVAPKKVREERGRGLSLWRSALPTDHRPHPQISGSTHSLARLHPQVTGSALQWGICQPWGFGAFFFFSFKFFKLLFLVEG